jgi:hypothetical protein
MHKGSPRYRIAHVGKMNLDLLNLETLKFLMHFREPENSLFLFLYHVYSYIFFFSSLFLILIFLFFLYFSHLFSLFLSQFFLFAPLEL